MVRYLVFETRLDINKMHHVEYTKPYGSNKPPEIFHHPFIAVKNSPGKYNPRLYLKFSFCNMLEEEYVKAGLVYRDSTTQLPSMHCNYSTTAGLLPSQCSTNPENSSHAQKGKRIIRAFQQRSDSFNHS